MTFLYESYSMTACQAKIVDHPVLHAHCVLPKTTRSHLRACISVCACCLQMRYPQPIVSWRAYPCVAHVRGKHQQLSRYANSLVLFAHLQVTLWLVSLQDKEKLVVILGHASKAACSLIDVDTKVHVLPHVYHCKNLSACSAYINMAA